MKVFYKCEKRAKKYLNNIQDVLNRASDFLNLNDYDLEVNVLFTTKSQIKSLNKNIREVNEVTDVLSFPNLNIGSESLIKCLNSNNVLNANPQTGNIILGDIALCVPKCLSQAKQYGTTPIREICYLALHGFLHLIGYDHINEDDKKLMRAKEDAIINSLDVNKYTK